MSRSVRLTAEAKSNLAAISDFIAADSPANAVKWLERIEAKIETIAKLPLRHAIAYSAADVGREVRQSFFGVYQILYVLNGEELVVITVRHGARRPLTPSEAKKLT
jgi:plasmid stabilization system protein ParE